MFSCASLESFIAPPAPKVLVVKMPADRVEACDRAAEVSLVPAQGVACGERVELALGTALGLDVKRHAPAVSGGCGSRVHMLLLSLGREEPGERFNENRFPRGTGPAGSPAPAASRARSARSCPGPQCAGWRP